MSVAKAVYDADVAASDPTPSCVDCGSLIAAVRAEVDPQAATLRYLAQCGHELDTDLAADLWFERGYRWTIPVVDGAALAAAERARQLAAEGHTPAHDAARGDTLAWAAWAYVDAAVHPDGAGAAGPPMMWPWSPDEWKAEATPIRRLTIAVALLLAELDRRLIEQREGRMPS